ncbi:ABC transporter ATP-binding protein [Nonomuraea fuscirosea]|uniref:ABC transporter ATP-binding protein n=1 Tax=Nonomuraea fuscirosea TaxID=1291556 RepID=UPI00342C77CB
MWNRARRPQPEEGPGRRSVGLLTKVAQVFAPHARLLLLSALLVVVSIAISIAGPLLLRAVIDDALPRRDHLLLGFLCGAMIVAGVLTGFCSWLQGLLINRVGQRVVHGLRENVYDRVQHSPLSFVAAEPNSRVQAVLVSDIGEISDVVTYSMQSILTSGIGMLAAIGVIMSLSWELGVLSVALAAGLSLFNRRLAKRRFQLTNECQDRVADMMRCAAEDLSYSGLVIGRTLGRTGMQRARFVSASADAAELNFRERMAGRAGYAWVGMLLSCVPPIIYWVAGAAFADVSVGTIIVVAMLQMRLTAPMEELMMVTADIHSSLAVFRRVFGYLDIDNSVTINEHAPGEETAPTRSLAVRDVSYVYPEAGRPSLRSVSLDVASGGVTVLLGHSGSGKSTLGLIMAGLLTPATGSVSCGGRVLREAELRNLVTLVPQEAPVFNTSIRNNLLFAKPEATPAELAEVIELVRLHTLIRNLAEGMDTTVGERGYELSGGERQRLALARAMLSPSRVLILDEAMSALDTATSDEVYAALRAAYSDGSLVCIAHRIPVVHDEDMVVLIDDGRIAEHGRHADLSQAAGPYARLLASRATV